MTASVAEKWLTMFPRSFKIYVVLPLTYGSKRTRPLGLAILVAALCLSALSGHANNGQFQNPLNSGPDPYCEFFEGNYYLTTTQRDAIRMWKSPTLRGLKTAAPITIWTDTEPSRCRGIWAPEFHFITNRWYVYYTATSADGNDANHRMHVLESKDLKSWCPFTQI